MPGEARLESDHAGNDAAPRKGGCDDTGSEKAQYGNHKSPVSTLAQGAIPLQATASDDTPPSMSSDLGTKSLLSITVSLGLYWLLGHLRSPSPNRLEQPSLLFRVNPALG
jgi:hypothetical protein